MGGFVSVLMEHSDWIEGHAKLPQVQPPLLLASVWSP